MPNWCENDLYIYGPESERKRFLYGACADIGQSFSWIEAYYPVPNALHEIASPTTVVEDGSEIEISQFSDQRMQITRTEASELIDKYGALNWYDWSIKNWGTKWPDRTYDWKERKTSLVLHFDTAWSPPIQALTYVSRMFPKLKFKMRYYEGGNGYQGYVLVHNGEVLEEEDYDYSGKRGG